MSFNPITASEKIKNYYLRYIETAFFISDKTYFDQFSEKLADDSAFSKGPYLEATDSFKAGKSLDELKVTRIIIAHRLSTIINADKIYVIKDGEVIECGNYEELMKQNGYFAILAKRQNL